MDRVGTVEKRRGVFWLVLALAGLVVFNAVFRVFSGPMVLLIIIASVVSFYLHILQARYRKKSFGLFLASLSSVYNSLALAGLIVITDSRSMVWLLLFLVNMLRNPYLGFIPSVLNGIVSVLCFIFLAVNVYRLEKYEIALGSLIFFTAAVLAWVLTLQIWLFEQQSMRDGLTGLRNRRSLKLALRQEIKQCLQNNRPISLLMIDVDNFKKYNDTLGHIRGDRILKELAEITTSCIRDGDLIFRYGGEEFCVILPGMTLDKASRIAERIREQIERSYTGHEIPVTVSIGVSSSEGDAYRAKYLLELADSAMYRAKIFKNRVIAT